jgi:hypothetical protein
MSRWTDWYWKWWLIIAIGLGFVVPEFWSLYDGDPQTQPLTNWTVARGLGELAAVVGLFLALHFGIREIQRRRKF